MHNINFSYYLDMVSNVLLLLAILLNIPRMAQLKLYIKLIIILFVVFISITVPFYMGSNLLWLMRGMLENISITTTLFLFILLLNNLCQFSTKPLINTPSAAILVIICTILYLSVFGIIPIDVYDLGFVPNVYFLCILGIVLLIIWRFSNLNAWILLIAFITYYFRLKDSINLWDYLIDPLLWVYAIIFLFKQLVYKRFC
ncbi:MAG: hypothetical protein ACK5Z5_01230 [Neisseriaceae bacterium]